MGLPGAGKTTVARLAALELDAEWHDLDAAVEAAAGRSVAEIFAVKGEVAFRTLEHEAMERLLSLPPSIIAAGGGWAAQPDNLAATASRSLSLYLCVTPEVAAARLGGFSDRPLLAGGTLPRLRELLAERERWYQMADLEIDARSSPEVVAAGVATAARQYGGW